VISIDRNAFKALVATPAVLEMMSKQLDWTQKLGNAALAQQADVVAAIQRLRSKAYDNKKLISTKEQTITLSQADDKRVVSIAPATPDIISVPYYDPWPYSDDPSYSFAAAPYYIPAEFIGSGIVFGASYLLGRWTDGGNYWGGGIYWDRGDIGANRPINIDRDRVTHWQHDPRHRRGLEYPHANVRQKFASTDSRPGRDARDQLRTERNTALKPGAGQPRAADRSAAARKASSTKAAKKNAATRPASPKSAAARTKRPASGQRRAHASARPSRSARVAPRRSLVRASPDIVRDMQALAGPAAASEAVGSEGGAPASAVAGLEEAGAAGKDALPTPPVDFHCNPSGRSVPTMSASWHWML
jgi:hypothetical protein